jgi:Asparagine synthase
MRAFLAIEHLAVPSIAAAEMDAISRVAVPIPTSECEVQRWRSDDGRVEFLAWTNEPGPFPARAWIDTGGAIGLVGRWAGAGARPVTDEVQGELTTSVRSLQGGHGGVAAYDDPPGIHAWNGIVGMAPIFYQSSDERVAVSDRPLLAHLVATGRTLPAYDIDALPTFLSLGYFPGEQTPYLGLKVLARGTDLRLQAGRATVDADVRRQTVLAADATAVASALVAACGWLRDCGAPVELALSGGRDSRIVAAALAAAGVPFTAGTRGTPSHPDVVIAKEVARRLGIAHRTNTRGTRTVPHSVDVDVEEWTIQSLRASDGLLGGFEGVPAVRPRFNPSITINGHCGELFRGGYATYARTDDLTNPDAFWTRLRRTAVPILAPSARATLPPGEVAGSTIPIAAGAARMTQLYLDERIGRWASAVAMARASSRALFQPLLDGEVVARALGCDPEDARTERLAFEVLRLLRPDLADLPITARRWSFEESGPTDLAPEGWPLRSALAVPVAAGGEIDWRRTAGGALDEEFRRRILGSPERDGLFDIVDRTAVERMLAGRTRSGRPARSIGRSQLLWAVYSAATLLSSDWLNERATERPIRIDARPTPPDEEIAQLGRVATWARRAIRRRG